VIRAFGKVKENLQDAMALLLHGHKEQTPKTVTFKRPRVTTDGEKVLAEST